MPDTSKWRLVIQKNDQGECTPYLLEFLKLRLGLDGKLVPIWKAPTRAAADAYPDFEITVRPKPSHFYRLTTGGIRREQVMSESLNFRGMWPQEVYVYMREFQHAIHKYVYDTFAEEMEHERRRREFDRRMIEERRQRRESEKAARKARNAKIVELYNTGKKPFGIAVEMGVSLSVVRNAIWLAGREGRE